MACVNFAHAPTAARIVDDKDQYATCMHKDIGTGFSMFALNFQPNGPIVAIMS